jgi:hypothetical protein
MPLSRNLSAKSLAHLCCCKSSLAAFTIAATTLSSHIAHLPPLFSANLSRNHHQWLLGGFNLLRIWGNSGKTFAIQCACSFNSLSNSLNFFRSSFVNPSGCRFRASANQSSRLNRTTSASSGSHLRYFAHDTAKPKPQMVLIPLKPFPRRSNGPIVHQSSSPFVCAIALYHLLCPQGVRRLLALSK